MTQDPLLILGGGYTGKALFHRATAEGRQVWCTSRQPNEHLADIPSQHRLLFDLCRPETWVSLPSPASIIWCFPAHPLELVQDFWSSKLQHPGRMIVLGSTSAYPSDGTTINEQQVPNRNLPRVQGEEYLRKHGGAIILRFAGLYGPGRNVLDWIRKGKIRNTSRFVNLLHVEDAVGICLKALEEAPDGSTYLASDGLPRPWSEICTYAATRWHIPIPPLTDAPDPGKRIDNRKLLQELSFTFLFPDLYDALDQLELQNVHE